MILFPAIDLKNGFCVRLEQGDMARATIFHRDPAEQARSFVAQGFDYLHVVDLDGAFAGRPMNAAAVDRVLAAVKIPLQLGGGIRDRATVEKWLGNGVARVIAELRTKFDWIICDSPAGIERGATLAMRNADAAIIVTNPEVSSVRDSDRIIGLLDSKTAKAERGERVAKHLLITRYSPARAARGEMLSIDDVLEILSTPLLGIIPESEEVLRASNVGAPVTLSNTLSAPAVAYFEAARRLKGEEIPLVVPSASRSILNRLFGRKAA